MYNFGENNNRDVSVAKVSRALFSCYNGTSFSTFHYLLYNYTSAQTLHYTNSGNCIALSMFIKNYLKEH